MASAMINTLFFKTLINWDGNYESFYFCVDFWNDAKIKFCRILWWLTFFYRYGTDERVKNILDNVEVGNSL